MSRVGRHPWAASGPQAILVTGGAGYIGSHVCKALAGAGYRPVVYDNLSRGHRWAVKWGPLETGDLIDGRTLRKVLKRYRIEAVVHLAAYAYVGESTRAPQIYFRNNLVGSLALLDAMMDVGVEFIVFSSTCATFGEPHRLPIADDHPQQPVSPYGESKLAVEKALRWYGEAHGLAWVALRYFNAAGADPDGELGENHDPETHLIPLALQAALGRRPYLEIFGTDYATPDGTAVRDYIHVTDLADAHVRALAYLLRGGASSAFNLGAERGHSVREVIRAVERVSGRRVPVREAPRRPGDAPALVAQASRASSVLRWRPRWSELDTIVATALLWHLTQHRSKPATVSKLRLLLEHTSAGLRPWADPPAAEAVPLVFGGGTLTAGSRAIRSAELPPNGRIRSRRGA